MKSKMTVIHLCICKTDRTRQRLDILTDGHADRWMDELTDGQADGWINWQMGTLEDRQMVGQYHLKPTLTKYFKFKDLSAVSQKHWMLSMLDWENDTKTGPLQTEPLALMQPFSFKNKGPLKLDTPFKRTFCQTPHMCDFQVLIIM